MSHDGNAPTGQEPVDRKAMLLEQFNAVEAEGSKAVDTPVIEKTDEKVTTEKVEKVEAAPGGDGGLARDERGRFASTKPVEPAAPVAQPQTDALAAPAVAPVPVEPWQSAPKSWKKELWEGWNKLDPAYQRYVHEREQQMRAGIEPLLPKAELADKINQAAEPYLNTIRGLGLDLPTAVGGLMKVDHDLRTLPYEQKLQVLAQVARSYGVDLTGQLAQAQPAYAPEFQTIQNELLAVKGTVADFQKQQEAAEERAALAEIEAFRQSAEHFDELKPLMAKLLQGGVASGIKDAYEQALRLTPEIFDQIQAAKQATAEAEKKKAADEAAKRARAAAVSVKSATPGSQKPTNAQDRRSMLREQFDSLSERL